MSWSDTHNAYHRTTIVIDRFDDGTQQLVKNETDYHLPPCQSGGCRNCTPDGEACEFDPKSGLCGGRMA